MPTPSPRILLLALVLGINMEGTLAVKGRKYQTQVRVDSNNLVLVNILLNLDLRMALSLLVLLRNTLSTGTDYETALATGVSSRAGTYA